MQGSWERGRMLRKTSSWQTWTKTYGSERKRNDRAHEKHQWKKAANAMHPDATASRRIL